MKQKNNLIIAFLLLFFLTSGYTHQSLPSPENLGKSNIIKQEIKGTIVEPEKIEGILEVHFIDVGQGDSILIRQGNFAMLIDAGDNQYGDVVVNYLEELGVETLTYVIGTHPHADHIGGLDDVILAMDVEKVIMPKVGHTTKTFEDVLLAIQAEGLKVTTPIVGDKYNLGEAEFVILGPNQSQYDNLNDYSVAIKLSFVNNSFVFAGDTEVKTEQAIMDTGLDLSAEVLKLSHHGSDTSNSDSFLAAVNPRYAVIPVGVDNSYEHPNKDVLGRVLERGIQVYRTDLDGDILIISDGEKIMFQ